MEIKTHNEGGVGVVACSGPLTLVDGREQLFQAFEQFFEQGTTRIVLDLAGVPYMDSAAIGGVMLWVKRATERGGAVRLVAPAGGKVRQILELTGLHEIVPVFEDAQAAAGDFASGS